MPNRRPGEPAPGDPTFTSELEGAKAARWAQLLFKCARLVNDRALAEVHRRTGLHVRPAHTSLFPHIDLAGTRPSVLAQKLGVSKQAIGQTVDELVAMGMVERVPDPADARAQLIRFSALGRKGLLDGLAVLADLEQQLAADVGPAEVDQMHRTLARLLQVLERPAKKPGKKNVRKR